MKMEEVWKLAEGFEDRFEVCNFGYIRSLDREVMYPNGSIRLFKGKNVGNVATNGYKRVSVGNKEYLVHRLIAETFINNPQNKPCVNHIDGNKLNNHVDNLEWATYKENNNHAYAVGLNNISGENNAKSKLKESDVVEIIKLAKERTLTLDEISKMFNVSDGHISNILSGRSWAYLTGGTPIVLENKQKKLNEASVLKIKEMLKEGELNNEEIGNMFNVSKHTIAAIKHGKVWKHVTP